MASIERSRLLHNWKRTICSWFKEVHFYQAPCYCMGCVHHLNVEATWSELIKIYLYKCPGEFAGSTWRLIIVLFTCWAGLDCVHISLYNYLDLQGQLFFMTPQVGCQDNLNYLEENRRTSSINSSVPTDSDANDSEMLFVFRRTC